MSAASPWEDWRNADGRKRRWTQSARLFAGQLSRLGPSLDGRAIALKAARHARSAFPPQTKGSAPRNAPRRGARPT